MSASELWAPKVKEMVRKGVKHLQFWFLASLHGGELRSSYMLFRLMGIWAAARFGSVPGGLGKWRRLLPRKILPQAMGFGEDSLVGQSLTPQ